MLKSRKVSDFMRGNGFPRDCEWVVEEVLNGVVRGFFPQPMWIVGVEC